MATVLAVVTCRGCKVQVFDDGTILRIDEPIAAQQTLAGQAIVTEALRTSVAVGPVTAVWADTWQNGPLVGWDPLR